MTFKMNPTKEYVREIVAFANEQGPDVLAITPSKAVTLHVVARRKGKVLFKMDKVQLAKGQEFQLTDFTLNISVGDIGKDD